MQDAGVRSADALAQVEEVRDGRDGETADSAAISEYIPTFRGKGAASRPLPVRWSRS